MELDNPNNYINWTEKVVHSEKRTKKVTIMVKQPYTEQCRCRKKCNKVIR